MKRDWDLIRKMILKIEDSPSGWAPDSLAIEGYTVAQINYHAYLLIDAGLATGQVLSIMPSEAPEGAIQYLTWEGHEFAESIRNDTFWKNAWGVIHEKGGSITIDILKQLLASIIKASLGLP